MVTGEEIRNNADFELYVGGSTDKKGAHGRMSGYLAAKRKGSVAAAAAGAHLALALKPGCQLNLRLMAEFARKSIPPPYVYFLGYCQSTLGRCRPQARDITKVPGHQP